MLPICHISPKFSSEGDTATSSLVTIQSWEDSMAIIEIASVDAQAYFSQTGHGGGGLVAKSCPSLVTP